MKKCIFIAVVLYSGLGVLDTELLHYLCHSYPPCFLFFFFNLALQEVQMSFEGKQLLQDVYLVFNIGVYKA